jgi:outer membrane protein assembly factor BamB
VNPETPNPKPAAVASKPAPSADDHPWKQPARRVAWVAGVYCALIAVALIYSVQRSRAIDPINNRELAGLKATLVQNPMDDALKARIRALDVELRREFLRHQGLVQKSGWLLLGGVLVLLPALHFATWRKRLPRRGKYVLQPLLAEVDNARSRLAVGVLAALVAGVGLWAVSGDHSDLEQVLMAKKAVVATTNTAMVAAAVDTSLPSAAEVAANWPRFRGPAGAAVSAYTNVPLTWNGTNGQNVLWKTSVPLFSPNSPVVWSNRVFMTGANSARHEVYAFDTADGKLLWQKQVGKEGKQLSKEDEEGKYFAPSTGATDGRRFYAIIETGDVAAFDFQGNQVWARNLGKPDNQYGYSTSLEVYKNTLLVQWDQGDEESGKSILMALNTATGQEVWKTAPRPVGASWATPNVVNAGGRDQLIASGNPWLISYDPAGGAEFWRAKVCGGEVTPSAVFAGGFVISANEKLSVIKPDGSGDVTKTHVPWRGEDGIPDICSPVSDGKFVYLLTSSGTLTVYDLATGKKAYEKELEIEVKSSPSVAGDRVYIAGEKGVTFVVQTGPFFKELARAGLGEDVLASPAFADGRIYLRGRKQLFCVGVKP